MAQYKQPWVSKTCKHHGKVAAHRLLGIYCRHKKNDKIFKVTKPHAGIQHFTLKQTHKNLEHLQCSLKVIWESKKSEIGDYVNLFS